MANVPINVEQGGEIMYVGPGATVYLVGKALDGVGGTLNYTDGTLTPPIIPHAGNIVSSVITGSTGVAQVVALVGGPLALAPTVNQVAIIPLEFGGPIALSVAPVAGVSGWQSSTVNSVTVIVPVGIPSFLIMAWN